MFVFQNTCLAPSRARKHVFYDPQMLFVPVCHRTVVGAKHHWVRTTHLNRGAQSNWVDPPCSLVGWRPLVLARPAGGLRIPLCLGAN